LCSLCVGRAVGVPCRVGVLLGGVDRQ